MQQAPARPLSTSLIGAMLRMLLAIALAAGLAAPATAAATNAQTAWRLLDYLAVDYAGAVAGGKVVSASEYAEMREFSGSVGEQLAALPANPAKPPPCSNQGAALQSAIDRKAAAPVEPALAQTLGSRFARAPTRCRSGPRQIPDARPRRPALRRELRRLPRRDGAMPIRRWRASSIRRRSPSPTASRRHRSGLRSRCTR